MCAATAAEGQWLEEGLLGILGEEQGRWSMPMVTRYRFAGGRRGLVAAAANAPAAADGEP